DAALALARSTDERDLKEALAAFEDLGARTAAAEARRKMRERGVRTIPRGPRATTRAAPAGPTAREREVLELVSEGRPNREISKGLSIPERTVHHHAAGVLAKIGVPSRPAAAREAARIGVTRPLRGEQT